MAAAEQLDLTVVDMRFVKPIDEALIDNMAQQHDLLVTLEENTVMGGAGSAVSEYLNQSCNTIPVLQLGLPDTFVEHGTHAELLAQCGLDAKGIEASIHQRLSALFPNSTPTQAVEPLIHS